MGEAWNWSYVTLLYNDRRYRMKCLHYISYERQREFFRIYGEDFKETHPAHNQIFGFGITWEKAAERFFKSIDDARNKS